MVTAFAVIKGSAINNDGSGKVTPHQIEGMVAEAHVRCQVEPETVNYRSSRHALGDPIEITALSKFFRASTEKRASAPSVQSKQISVI